LHLITSRGILAQMPKRLQQLFTLALVVSALFLAWRYYEKSKAKALESERHKAEIGEKTSHVLPTDSIALADGYLSIESGIPAQDADRRPYWRVDGRIMNFAKVPVSRVKVRIDLQLPGDSGVIDAAEFDLATDIPSGEERGFSQRIRMLPPPNGSKWEWSWEVVCVESGYK
jgi:hypothetical protein